MGKYVKYSEVKFPDWLHSNILSHCECGEELDYYFNDSNECTRVICSNKECPYNNGAKISTMCTILNVKGVGYATGVKYCKEYKLKNHFEFIPVYFQEKPNINLKTLFRLAFIYGYDSKLESIIADYKNVEDFFENYNGFDKSIFDEYEELLKYGYTVFNVEIPYDVQYDAIITGKVNITGELSGYSNREDFVLSLNKLFKGKVRITLATSARKTGLIACITEDASTGTRKIKEAREGGIPIMKPEQFLEYIITKLDEKGELGGIMNDF